MIKTLLKLLLCIVVYTIVYILANAVLPFSKELMEANSSINPLSSIMFLPIKSAWVCFTLYFIIRNACFGGKKLFINLIIIMFFTAFTQHIDTFFIRSAFPFMAVDIITLILSSLFPLLAAVPLLLHFFQNKGSIEKKELSVKKLILKLGIIGIIYLAIYFLFGLLIIWKIEESRMFYSSIENNPLIIIPFQVLRGILFGIFVLPLINMVKTKKIFIISICLVYLCLAVDLIIPNALLPARIRIAHLIEMTSSMTLFGIITGNILWGKKINTSQKNI